MATHFDLSKGTHARNLSRRESDLTPSPDEAASAGDHHDRTPSAQLAQAVRESLAPMAPGGRAGITDGDGPSAFKPPAGTSTPSTPQGDFVPNADATQRLAATRNASGPRALFKPPPLAGGGQPGAILRSPSLVATPVHAASSTGSAGPQGSALAAAGDAAAAQLQQQLSGGGGAHGAMGDASDDVTKATPPPPGRRQFGTGIMLLSWVVFALLMISLASVTAFSGLGPFGTAVRFWSIASAVSLLLTLVIAATVRMFGGAHVIKSPAAVPAWILVPTAVFLATTVFISVATLIFVAYGAASAQPLAAAGITREFSIALATILVTWSVFAGLSAAGVGSYAIVRYVYSVRAARRSTAGITMHEPQFVPSSRVAPTAARKRGVGAGRGGGSYGVGAPSIAMGRGNVISVQPAAGVEASPVESPHAEVAVADSSAPLAPPPTDFTVKIPVVGGLLKRLSRFLSRTTGGQAAGLPVTSPTDAKQLQQQGTGPFDDGSEELDEAASDLRQMRQQQQQDKGKLAQQHAQQLVQEQAQRDANAIMMLLKTPPASAGVAAQQQAGGDEEGSRFTFNEVGGDIGAKQAQSQLASPSLVLSPA